MADLQSELGALRNWLRDAALPFQANTVRDAAGGGFHERISPTGEPLSLPRRARVSARQLYAFSRLAALIGDAPALELGKEAYRFLTAAHLQDDGAVVPEVMADRPPADMRFDLYDYAFAIFALAAADPRLAPPGDCIAKARQILVHAQSRWRHPEAGFEEADPRILPLRANPHMHLLEAAMAWIEAGDHDGPWHALADEIVELCLARFIDPASGALRELFDGDWEPLADAAGPGGPVEPGHQYEWAWLLLRWGRLRESTDAQVAAERMIQLAEDRGVDDRRDLAVSALTTDLDLLDPLARLWPQTERIKAFVALAEALKSRGAARQIIAEAEKTCARAIAGLRRFFDHPLPGAWWENIDEQGVPLCEPCRTSSLYHIVCAYAEAERLAT